MCETTGIFIYSCVLCLSNKNLMKKEHWKKKREPEKEDKKIMFKT